MTHAETYKTKFVAFIDLLGFKHSIEQSALEEKRQRKVAFAISTLQTTACKNDEHDIALTGFSDNLVISADVTALGLDSMLRMIGQIARNLLQEDILIRGGVSLGAIHHDGDDDLWPRNE